MIITPNTVRITFSDGKEYIQPYMNDKIEFPLLCTVLLETDDDGTATPKIIPYTDIYPEKLIIEISLENCSENTWVYFSDNGTNAMCEVKLLSSLQKDFMKEIGCIKDKENNVSYNVGMVTANRIFTHITVTPTLLAVEYDLEERLICAGDSLTLESFFTSDLDIQDFLDVYTTTVIKHNKVRPLSEPLVGWCSWSCYFGDVNEEKILNNIEDMTAVDGSSLIQIDDGWQKYGTFCGDWYFDENKFPNGIRYLAEKANASGMKFGLWLAPLIIFESSPHYEKLKDFVRTDIFTPPLEKVHPFDLDNPAFYDHLTRVFRRMHEEYGADYFKLDFLMHNLCILNEPGKMVRYKSDYRVALFRKAIQTIRNAVGDDAILLSCGSPMLECVGIFDAQRTTADIIWGKSKDLPTYWEIMRKVSKTSLYRGFYNGKIFRNDPDGIVLRDFDRGDGFDCKYHEARFWATTVAMSGGLNLLNEEYRNLSPARRKLFDKLLPPIGIAGKLADFFEETPHPTAAVLKLDEKTTYLALYHYEDEITDKKFDLSRIGHGRSIVIDCWEGRILDVTDCIELPNRMPHSADLLCIVPVPTEPEFLFEDSNVWLGRNGITGKNSRYTVCPDGCTVPENSAVIYKANGICVVKE